MKTVKSKTLQPLLTSTKQLTWVLMLLLLSFMQAHATKEFNIKPDEVPDSCNADLAQIRVTVHGIEPRGVLNVELYDDPEHFLFKKGRKRKVRTPAEEGSQQVCINLEQPGTYAVAAYHDLDGNRKLKRQWNLLPREPFGLSNNPEQHMGFPKFSDSAFTATGLGADIVINLKQP
ncbi:DUF2141 domain-containing protein [Nitrosomonas ureae]|uniref:Uncharacterized conserved protein, DUF2141 family n=1 Tax=Nitrosomonas ureae TaxID=44577 RepID=A0A286A6S6_9PROT|nr:DUF2141 domain-containing protein [Nitrosomonas ureae]SOD17606.1 Uncharacterized conserved protein, DUF2141 family [Nitrosomonas ureae]